MAKEKKALIKTKSKENKPPKSPKRQKIANDFNNNKSTADTAKSKEKDKTSKSDKKKSSSKHDCKFGEFGCKFKGSDSKSHTDAEPIMHLSLLNDAAIGLRQQVYKLVDYVNDMGDSYDMMWSSTDRIKDMGTGAFIWRIGQWNDVYNLAMVGTTSVLHSPGFYTARHGYRMIVSMCPYGDGKVRGQYLSVFVALVKGDYDNLLMWPFSYKVKIVLLDQEPHKADRLHHAALLNVGKPSSENLFLRKPVGERNPSFGLQKFIDLKMLQTRKYVHEDQVYLKVELTEDENAASVISYE